MKETQARLQRRWFHVSLREWFLFVAMAVTGLALWREYTKSVNWQAMLKRTLAAAAISEVSIRKRIPPQDLIATSVRRLADGWRVEVCPGVLGQPSKHPDAKSVVVFDDNGTVFESLLSDWP